MQFSVTANIYFQMLHFILSNQKKTHCCLRVNTKSRYIRTDKLDLHILIYRKENLKFSTTVEVEKQFFIRSQVTFYSNQID